MEQVQMPELFRFQVQLCKNKFHKFSPHGITGIAVVAESHFAIHTGLNMDIVY